MPPINPDAPASMTIEPGEAPFGDIPDELRNAPVTTQTGLAAIAMNFALKYADISTIQEGGLYQQYKLEGRNMREIHLDHVFEYAKQIERHLLEAPSRLALLALNAVAEDVDAILADEESAANGEPESDAEQSA